MKGFTLIEVLLVVAIILTIGFFSGILPVSFIHQNATQNVFQNLSGSLNKAQAYALAGKRDSAWGVRLEGEKIILFKGNSFAQRETALDEETEIDSGVAVSGFSEVMFSRPEGRLASEISGINISQGNERIIFSLNEEGAIEQ
jgi:prepilin-type N-terminal cleavage/methylation domain-containing protein